MSLLEKYEQMKLAEAKEQEQEKTAEVEVPKEDLEVIEKYASAADDLLAKEYGEEYTEQDVIDLASAMLKEDIVEAEEQEKVASLEEAGKVIARSFLETIKEAK